jgi:hypothetical protein
MASLLRILGGQNFSFYSGAWNGLMLNAPFFPVSIEDVEELLSQMPMTLYHFLQRGQTDNTTGVTNVVISNCLYNALTVKLFMLF